MGKSKNTNSVMDKSSHSHVSFASCSTETFCLDDMDTGFCDLSISEDPPPSCEVVMTDSTEPMHGDDDNNNNNNSKDTNDYHAMKHNRRFTVPMTIIAATSPEIKALNLPKTPTFPDSLLHGGDCDQSLEDYSFFSMTTQTQQSNEIHPIVDNHQSLKSQSEHYTHSMSCCSKHEFNDHDTDTRNRGLTVTWHHHPDSNKENIPPNMRDKVYYHHHNNNNNNNNNGNNDNNNISRCHPPRKAQQDRICKKFTNRVMTRKSRHRRGSFEHLPPPNEILPLFMSHKAPGPKGPIIPSRSLSLPYLPSTATTTSGGSSHEDLALFPCRRLARSSAHSNHNHHSDSIMPLRMLPKSFQLSTGFR